LSLMVANFTKIRLFLNQGTHILFFIPRIF
jgi:hypothetical protein